MSNCTDDKSMYKKDIPTNFADCDSTVKSNGAILIIAKLEIDRFWTTFVSLF
jgi:hypothetical protein